MSQTVEEPDDEDEDPVRMSPKRADEEEIDITPMIDIVFLLLIFFVVTSKMDPTQMGQYPKADAGLPVSAKDSAVIFIVPAGPDTVIISDIDGNEFSTDEELLATEIVEYVTEELDKGRNQVMILADEDTRVYDVTRVQKIIGDAFETLENTFIAVKEE